MDDSRARPRHVSPNAAARRRRRLRRLSVTLAAAAAMLVTALATGYMATRAIAEGGLRFGPPRVTFAATPKDARISIASATGTGTVTPVGVKPGVYRLTVTRRGFVPIERSVTLRRGQQETIALALEPRPTVLVLDIKPSSARYSIATSTGRKLEGHGSFRGRVPAGATTVRITSKGCRPVVHRLVVDAPTFLTDWLDPRGQIVHEVGTFSTVPAPKGVAITPDDSEIWTTALVTQPSILIQDPRTGRRIGSVDLGSSGAVEVVFNRAGTRAYASQMQSASVYEIDVRTRRVLRRFRTGSSWTKIVHIAPDERRIYAANWTGDDISEIDLRTGTLVRRMPTVDTPRGCWPTADGRRLFVAGFGESTGVGRLGVIDLKTGKTKVFYQKRGAAMRHMVADEKRGLLFTSDLGRDRILVTDMKTLKTRTFVETDRKPNTIDLSPDGTVLFVSCRGENNPRSYYEAGPEWGTVLLFDAKTGKALDAMVGGNQCTALDLSPSGKLLVFSDFLDAKLHVYDVPPYETLARGNGGRYLAHFGEIVRPGWDGWDGPTPPSAR